MFDILEFLALHHSRLIVYGGLLIILCSLIGNNMEEKEENCVYESEKPSWLWKKLLINISWWTGAIAVTTGIIYITMVDLWYILTEINLFKMY